jgi:putative adhesin
MARWTVDEPTKIDFDGVVALKANIVAGTISVLPTSDRPTLQVSEISAHPLEVVHEAGMLSLSHKSSGVEGILRWLQFPRGRVALTVTVPADCPVTLNLVTAHAVITDMTGRVSVNTGAGDVTLDGVTGAVEANTATGAIQAQGLGGSVKLNSVSGELALARGLINELNAYSVSGRITTDVDLRDSADVQIGTVSGEVTVRLPKSTSARVKLTSLGGRIDAGFAGLDRTDRSMNKKLAGTLGGGAARLSVNSVSGAIALLSRPDREALTHEGEDD